MTSTKRLTGPVEDTPPRKRRDPNAVEASRPHQFGGGGRGQPTWLNGDDGRRVCQVCGVEVSPPGGGLILADHAGFGDDGKTLLGDKPQVGLWTYVDAKGHQFTSQKELGCPVFVLDHLGTTMENRAMLREVDDRVDCTDSRVDSVEDRLAALETENAALREQVAQPIDVTQMVDFLSDMVAMAAARKLGLTRVQLEDGRVAQLPEPVADLIIDIASVPEPEGELVPIQDREEKQQPPLRRFRDEP